MSKKNNILNREELIDKYPDVPKFVVLKLDVQKRGIKLTEDALAAVQGPKYKFESRNAYYGTDDPENRTNPGPVILRDGTSVLVFAGLKYEDPYIVDYKEGKFLISDKGKFVDEVDFTPRPDFYGKKTSRGVPMESIASARPQRIDISPYRYCHFWDTGEQCKYCAFFTDLKEQRQAAGDKFEKVVDPEDIYETVREALKEPGRISQINLTAGADFSGTPAYENEVNRYIKVLQAIGRNFKSRRFPSQLIAPAYTKQQLKRIHEETGLSSYCPDIEVWDEKLFKWICPGKEKWLGRDYWLKSTLDAVEIFGKGNVYTNFVAGAETAQPHGFKTIDEALKSNFEAAEFFSKHGVIFLSLVWRPYKSSIFADQKQPPLEYFVRLVKGIHEIRKSYGLTSDNDDYKHCGNHGDSDLERLD
jgi:hypothetical protein